MLQAAPASFAAGHMLGVLCAQQGRNEEAAALIGAAVKANPRSADALTNHGNILNMLGRHAEALASFDKALALQVDPTTLNNKGSVLHKIGRLDEALDCYQQAIALQPGYAEACFNCANTLFDMGRFADAIAQYDKAIEIAPHYADAVNKRGVSLHELSCFEEAVAGFDQALAIRPDDAQILSNRSVSLWSSGKFTAALESADLALAVNPRLAPTWSHRGNVLRALDRPQDALDSYDRAIALDHDYAEAHLNKSYCLLLAGRWREGWPLFEWRKRLPVPIAARTFAQPLWTGTEDLKGKTLFVYAEQGLGDTIQFFRYCDVARERGAQVILAAQNGLVRLLRTADPRITVIDLDAVPPHFDTHTPLMSFPLCFNTTVEIIPEAGPYLKAEPAKLQEWAGTIGKSGFRIGIAWRGDDRGARRGRSFPLESFEKLARLPGVRLISLQKDATEHELQAVAPGMDLEVHPFDNGPDAFTDTAAIMQHLDLVITADTSIAHLAGALGVRTWIALKHLPDWRWLTRRTDSPWYSSVTLYRQPVEG
ncbi:MAG TPA: tetratricopeptide repeat protein, partial [Rhizomicrobium sp.]|nr:tetratricopeptide repeat protein [Rhizomicrobium sp.]